MQKTRIGNSPLEIAPINLGGNVFGWTVDEARSFRILDAFLDRGFNFIDTADIYSVWAEGHGGGESETIIGKWLHARGNRDQIVLATKVGGDHGDGRKGLERGYMESSLEGSLRRLQTDRIDLYYTHFDDESVPVADVLGSYAGMIDSGKVRYIGASNMSPERLRASLELGADGSHPRYEALQPHYNLIERAGYEQQYAPLAAEYNLTVFPYFALASGFLTGKYRSGADLDKSVRGSTVGKKYLNARGLSILKALDEVADRHETTPAAISLAWLLAQPHIGAPISSVTKLYHLDAMVAATEINLAREDLERLGKASAPEAG